MHLPTIHFDPDSTEDHAMPGAKVRCWIYFAQGTDGGPIKIGMSTRDDPRRRIAALQVGYPFGTLRLVGVFRGDPSREAMVHREFAAHRMCGEWFAPVPELVAFVRQLNPPHYVKTYASRAA